MTGNKLKSFTEQLPEDEKEALKALCEPDWDKEVVGIKKGPDGIMMLVAFIYSNCDTAPIYRNGEIRWLYDHEHFPDDQGTMERYREYPILYSEEMKPYKWRWDIMWGKEKDPILFLHMWLIKHDPEDVYLSQDEWYERDQVLKDLKAFEALHNIPDHRIPDPLYEEEVKKTRSSMEPIQAELKLIHDNMEGRQ